MSKISDISKLRKKQIEEEDDRKLNIEASFVIVETCLKMLNLSNLPELISLKISLRNTLKELRRLKNNG